MTDTALPRAIRALVLLATLGAAPVAAQGQVLGPVSSQLFRPVATRPAADAMPLKSQSFRDSTTSNGALNGALAGAAIGGGFGALVGYGWCECAAERTKNAFGLLLVGATVGFVIGGIIGSL